MKILFDFGHPAHVHLFKNFIFYLQKKNIKFDVVSREKEITNNLLKHYHIPFQSLSKPGTSLPSMLWEFIIRGIKVLSMHIKNKYTLAMGTSVSIGLLSFFTLGKVKSWNFCEDDDDIIPLQAMLSYPFSTKVVVPDCIRFKKWKNKRVTYPSYHELAYLHPNNFTPDEKVLEKYGLTKGKYIIFRLTALKAHHDVGAKGISKDLKQKIANLLDGYDIIESLEGKNNNKIEPWDMHHVLAFSKMIISDSQTMTVEAAVLGIPSMRINTFIGKSTLIDELEQKYELSYGILPSEEDKILNKLKGLINNQSLESEWQSKRKRLLSDKIDLNQWMINYFESNIK